MYSVYADGTCIYNDTFVDEGHRLVDPVLSMSDNSAGSFTATLLNSNVGYDLVKRVSTVITVKRDGNEIWAGRVINESVDFWNRRKITCEGELGYLNDTIQPPAEYHNLTIKEFLTKLLEIHNSKVPESKRFYIGNVNVNDGDTTNDDNEIYRYTNYEKTLECISQKLVERYKGHIVIRKENGVRYLDYLADYTTQNYQVIRFGKNLLDYVKNWELSDLATVVVPRGKTLDESPIEALTAYLTVADVNGGSIYVSNADAVNNFGWIEIVVDWSDVTDASNLLSKARKYLEDYQFDAMTLELTAVDMHYLTKSEEAIKLLQKVRIVSKPHGMDRYFPVTKIEIPLDKPADTKYTLGDDKALSLSGASNLATQSVLNEVHALPTKQIVLREAKETATELIHTATHGYVVMNYNEHGAYEILIMDQPTVDKATKIWRWNMNGLGYSSTGYNGTYGLALTSDGAIVADRITTGTMYANRIKGGQLTLGGFDNENGVIYVNNASGKRIITIDCNGINVNDKFTVDTAGNITAVHISGGALQQFSDLVDNSEAMQKANEAISKANSAASDAASAASAAASAAAKAQRTADDVTTHVNNINDTIIPDINNAIRSVSERVSALGG